MFLSTAASRCAVRHVTVNVASHVTLVYAALPWKHTPDQVSEFRVLQKQETASSAGSHTNKQTSLWKLLPPVCRCSHLLLLLHLQPLGSVGRQSAVQQPRRLHEFVGCRFSDAFSFKRDDVRKQRRRPQTETCRLRTVNPQQQLIPFCCRHSHPTCRRTDGQVGQFKEGQKRRLDLET